MSSFIYFFSKKKEIHYTSSRDPCPIFVLFKIIIEFMKFM
jgi:hypothetical protein